MKTFYLMQGALEEYLNESQSNGNGRGPDKWTPACDNPNPPHWCDEYNEPEPEPGATIDSNIGIGLLVGLIIIAAFCINKKYI